MPVEQITSRIELEYNLYKDDIGDVGSLGNLLDFISNARKMSETQMEYLEVQRSTNRVHKVLTMIFGPVLRFCSEYPPIGFYDADDELITIQGKMINQYHDWLDRLVQVANQDNMNSVYGLARFTVDKHTGNYDLVGSARSYMRNVLTGHPSPPVDLTTLDVAGFLGFFDETIKRESTVEEKVFELSLANNK